MKGRGGGEIWVWLSNALQMKMPSSCQQACGRRCCSHIQWGVRSASAPQAHLFIIADATVAQTTYLLSSVLRNLCSFHPFLPSSFHPQPVSSPLLCFVVGNEAGAAPKQTKTNVWKCHWLHTNSHDMPESWQTVCYFKTKNGLMQKSKGPIWLRHRQPL